MNALPDAGETVGVMPLPAPVPDRAEAVRGLVLPLNDGATVVWTLGIPPERFGAIRDAALGVTLVYDSVRTSGGWMRQFSGWRDSELPDVLRSWMWESKRGFRITSALDDIVAGLPRFPPREATC